MRSNFFKRFNSKVYKIKPVGIVVSEGPTAAVEVRVAAVVGVVEGTAGTAGSVWSDPAAFVAERRG